MFGCTRNPRAIVLPAIPLSKPVRNPCCIIWPTLKMDSGGFDTEGREYGTSSQFWKDEIGQGATDWYGKAVEYWDHQDNTVDGVLGGFGNLSEVDIEDSRAFLEQVLERREDSKCLAGCAESTEPTRALDGGAGVGRVSEHLLLKVFEKVDVVEPSWQLLETAKTRLGGGQSSSVPVGHSLDKFYCKGLQDFHPEPNSKYDCIWLQWCILYLTDDDLVQFLQRCEQALTPGGVIVIKENVCKSGFVVDRDDSSIARSDQYHKDLFERAGLKLAKEATQLRWPEDLFKVKMYALVPGDSSS